MHKFETCVKSVFQICCFDFAVNSFRISGKSQYATPAQYAISPQYTMPHQDTTPKYLTPLKYSLNTQDSQESLLLTYDMPSSPLTSHSKPLLYVPVEHHWFYCECIESQSMWRPFSKFDSCALEHAFLTGMYVPHMHHVCKLAHAQICTQKHMQTYSNVYTIIRT